MLLLVENDPPSSPPEMSTLAPDPIRLVRLLCALTLLIAGSVATVVLLLDGHVALAGIGVAGMAVVGHCLRGGGADVQR